MATAAIRPGPPQPRVFVAGPGKHLFLRLRDKRLGLYPEDWSGDLAPDFVVFPCGQIRRFAATGAELPPAVRARIGSGEARVVFDASDEGQEHGAALSETLHGFLERLGAPAGRAFYITQHRGFANDYQAFCAGAGVAGRMTILTYDYWVKRLIWPYEAKGEALFEHRRRLWRDRPRTRPRRYLSLNWSPRPTKLFFMLQLIEDGLWDEGYVSFGGFGAMRAMSMRKPSRLMRAMSDLAGFEDLYPRLSRHLQRLADLGAIEFRQAAAEPPLQHAHRRGDDLALAEYRQSWFSAVTESEMASRPVRVTEKVFKPLLNFHPLVVFGNPGSLDFLRGLGFESFPEMFDETYDTVADPRSRFDMAYAQVARLCRMDEAELARLDAAVAAKVEHNARVALIELPKRYRAEIDAGLVDRLLAPVAPSAAAAESLQPGERSRLSDWLPVLGRRRTR